MIKNKIDYKKFLQIEQNSNTTNFVYLYLKSSYKPTKRFLLLLRTCEYLKNSQSNILERLLYFFVKHLKYKLGIKLGFSIPENVAEEGLELPHYGTIIINAKTKIGKFCKIHACVNIGASAGGKEAPKIGNYVYIAPGAKLYGDIIISDRTAIAANAAVAKSFLESDIIIGGVPAKVIGNVDIFKILKNRS